VPERRRLVGYLLVAGAAASWGAQAVVVKLLLSAGIPAAGLVSTRTALAGVLVVATLAGVNPGLLRVDRGDLGRLVVLGLVGMAFSNYTDSQRRKSYSRKSARAFS
jgi:drug/metabolite transporter (DMT)-like permease